MGCAKVQRENKRRRFKIRKHHQQHRRLLPLENMEMERQGHDGSYQIVQMCQVAARPNNNNSSNDFCRVTAAAQ